MPSGWSDIELPAVTCFGAGRFTGDVELPAITVAATGVVGVVGEADIELPVVTVETTGLVEILGTADIKLPVVTVEGRSGFFIIIELPAVTVEATGLTGIVGSADVDLPDMSVSATGTVSVKGTADISIPIVTVASDGTVGEVGSADVSLPAITVEASGSITPIGIADVSIPVIEVYGAGTVAETILAICTELSIFAFSKYGNYSFNSMCKFGDVYLGCTDSAIYSLSSDGDAGSDIDAYFDSKLTDFEITNQKRIRKGYIGGESKGKLVLTTIDGDGTEREFSVDPWKEGSEQVGIRVAVDRDGKARYWKLRIANVDGCDFSIDGVKALIKVLAKKPKGDYNYGRMILPMATVEATGS